MRGDGSEAVTHHSLPDPQTIFSLESDKPRGLGQRPSFKGVCLAPTPAAFPRPDYSAPHPGRQYTPVFASTTNAPAPPTSRHLQPRFTSSVARGRLSTEGQGTKKQPRKPSNRGDLRGYPLIVDYWCRRQISAQAIARVAATTLKPKQDCRLHCTTHPGNVTPALRGTSQTGVEGLCFRRGCGRWNLVKKPKTSPSPEERNEDSRK